MLLLTLGTALRHPHVSGLLYVSLRIQIAQGWKSEVLFIELDPWGMYICMQIHS